MCHLSQHRKVPVFNGQYQSIWHNLYYRKGLFLWFHLFSFLRNDQFFLKKWQKVVSKTVLFLVNYVTFVIHYNSEHLLNFSKLTLRVCLLHTKTFLFYIAFLTMRRHLAIFFERNDCFIDLLFSKFIFPKPSRAPAHQV